MTQKKFNIKLVKQYINSNSQPKNKDLYQYCNAVTDTQKSNVRKEKSKILKKIKTLKKANPPGGVLSLGDKKLTSDYIEKLIKDGLDDDPKNVQLIGKAVDFFVKVKTDKKEGTKQLLNMEAFLQLAEEKRK